MARPVQFIISCEHGGNRIPPRYRARFAGLEDLLHSHRGHDPGALAVARDLATACDAPLFAATTSRLLIDLNRSIGHPKLYSEATRALPQAARRELVATHYLPHRNAVESAIAAAVAHGRRVIHVASHSFTPVLDGAVRNADVGLLYDPARPAEKALCLRWQALIEAGDPALAVRRNYPYAGKADGFTAYLRRRFADAAYAGVELELNQVHVLRGGRRWHALRRLIATTLVAAAAGR